MDTRYDFVVVGGGSAGAVMASRLSEDPGRRVLLIEAGPDFPDAFPVDLKSGSMANVEPNRNWGYLSAPSPNGHPIPCFAGKVMGGGSAINAAVSRRGRPADFERWVAHGLPEWSFDNVLETYKTLENTPDGHDSCHGRSGPWPIRQSKLEDLTPYVRAYIESAQAAGFAVVHDFNDPDQSGGVGGEATNIVEGVRYNTAMTYLTVAVRGRPNLTIRSDTLVDRLVFEDHAAKGVILADGSEVPAGEIALCCGVFGSPAVLLRSGVGPAKHLRGLGVEVIADLPVGERLRDQPMFVSAFPLKPDDAVASFAGSGVLWTSSSEAAEKELDLQLSISIQPGFEPDGAPLRVLSVWACLMVPHSTGKVRLKSRDPRVTPFIDFALLTEETDRTRLRGLVALARDLAQRPPAAGRLQLQGGGEKPLSTDLDAEIGAGLTTFLHATSSVPMGSVTDPSAVVDAWGRVHGLSGLRVVDASIFPEPVSVPTNLTVIMVAERIAEAIARGA